MKFPEPPPFLRPYVNKIRETRAQEEALAKSNPHLAEALKVEKHEGHRLAVIARTVALSIVGILLPFVNPHQSVIVYEILLLIFIALGWLQLKFAQVGQSRVELGLILADLFLMTASVSILNPWAAEPFPNAYVYKFNNFTYFYIILALSTLAFSWRTVWSIGTMVAFFWLLGVTAVFWFGYQVPQMTQAINEALPSFPIVASELDPNSVQWSLRIQEIVVFALVAGILALKGRRSNQLLIKQAIIAEERANLSRYFPSSLVDTLASTDHDIGAVRSEEIAVMFSDIVGFTKIAESMSPEDVMQLLRDYHSLVERAIFQHNGTLDKYLGDGVMATFGTPSPSPNDAKNALAAAQQIIRESQSLNASREAAGHVPFSVSVGLHYGPVILGDIGPERRLEFAVVGDTVNVAARVEAVTRELGCALAVSNDLIERTSHAPSNDLSLHKKIRLKGRATPIDIWTDG